MTCAGLAASMYRSLGKGAMRAAEPSKEEGSSAVEMAAFPAAVQLFFAMDMLSVLVRFFQHFLATKSLGLMATKSNLISLLTEVTLPYLPEFERNAVFDDGTTLDATVDIRAALDRSSAVARLVQVLEKHVTDDTVEECDRQSACLALLSSLNLFARSNLVQLQQQVLNESPPAVLMRVMEVAMAMVGSGTPPLLDKPEEKVHLVEELSLLVGYIPLNCEEGREAITLPCAKEALPFLHIFARSCPITLLSSARGRALLVPSLLACLVSEDVDDSDEERDGKEKKWKIGGHPSLASCQMILADEIDVIGLLTAVLVDEREGKHAALPDRLLPRRRLPNSLFNAEMVRRATHIAT
uniref:Uncharacterized protein n=1 Tax=Palpitomonas bilix TaxID=652834 RepID=A0A7S3DHV6_9EUKA